MSELVELQPELTVITDGLRFPEGPIAMHDGSVVLVEMFGPRLIRVLPDGTKETIAEIEGGPNGAAVGPDGMIYLCNNGGCFTPADVMGMTFPGPFDPSTYIGGRIQRVDPASGDVVDLYTECDGRPLRAPNDIVMDGHGGFFFTDHGIRDLAQRTSDLSAIYYAKVDGSHIAEVVFPVEAPNGIGLSPEGGTLYWAETHTGRVFRRSIGEPGVIEPAAPLDTSIVLYGLPGYQLLDSLAVDGEGWVCVATLVNGGITAISPDGSQIEHHSTGDLMTTNICFGGPDLRTAYITLSSTGQLVEMEWPRIGLHVAHM
ncbi:MAG: SMP-30/gluconolactonase/LRE family protein [Ilumatobacter sp.]|uniref:SMP-30/gluconolactonase/LRE family protein n=1 Tax=Ilumatobacter sp. TaxID=1967498 RepID=UPI003919EEDC